MIDCLFWTVAIASLASGVFALGLSVEPKCERVSPRLPKSRNPGMRVLLGIILSLGVLSCKPTDQTAQTKQQVQQIHSHAVEASRHVSEIEKLSSPVGKAQKSVDQTSEYIARLQADLQAERDSWFPYWVRRWAAWIKWILMAALVCGLGLRWVATLGTGLGFSVALWVSRTIFTVLTLGLSYIERLFDRLWHRQQKGG